MVVSLASSAYLASAASTLRLVQSAIGLHSIVKTPLYGFNEVLLEALRDFLPRMISLEATEQSLSHSGRVGQDRGSPVNDWSGFPRHFGRNVQPSFSELLSSIDPSDSGRRSYSIYLSGPRSREP